MPSPILRLAPSHVLGGLLSILLPAHASGNSPPSWHLTTAEAFRPAPLVRAVLSRNPTVLAARQAWRVAEARSRQHGELPDPVVSYSVAPKSVASEDARFGHVLSVRQRFESRRKRGLEVRAARAATRSAAAELEGLRLELAREAVHLYADLYVTERAQDVFTSHRELVAAAQGSAESRYATGRASQQDPLQAAVELAHVDHQLVVLRSQRAQLHAQLNGLLHRGPDAPLPPTPPRLLPPTTGEAAPRLHPDLQAVGERIRAGEARILRAEAERRPDFTVTAAYNWLWGQADHRLLLGLSWNLPVRRDRRRAAIDEARAEVARTRALREAREDALAVARRRAQLGLEEARHVRRLHQERFLPLARDRAAAARAGFEASRNDFDAVLDAERTLRNLELGLHKATAEVLRRRAELAEAEGRLPIDLGGGEGVAR